ncbi:unnamed protein product [Mytilus coruscus]|uniref:Uncharacterized protein n=1 Tax=Mytilus coruscus TaxID=42192 RepID=A0A6J8EMH3_MYTCO|nr:unnamed protein product [Mytilus coruscus]
MGRANHAYMESCDDNEFTIGMLNSPPSLRRHLNEHYLKQQNVIIEKKNTIKESNCISKNTMDSFNNDFMGINALGEKVKEQHEITLKWKHLPTGLWYKINEVNEVVGKFGKSSILTLKTREGGIFKVWACSGLNREMEPLEGAYIRSTGPKISTKSKQEYF